MPVATAIELENVELFEGTNKKVIVNVTPSDGYNVFDWKSDNEEVATVADDGTITGKSLEQLIFQFQVKMVVN